MGGWTTALEVMLIIAAGVSAFFIVVGDFGSDYRAIGIGVAVFAGIQTLHLGLSMGLTKYTASKEPLVGRPTRSFKDLYDVRRRGVSTLIAVSGITLAFLSFVPEASLIRTLLACIFIFTVVAVLLYETLLTSAEDLVNDRTRERLTGLRQAEWLGSQLPYVSFVLGLSILVVSVAVGEL